MFTIGNWVFFGILIFLAISIGILNIVLFGVKPSVIFETIAYFIVCLIAIGMIMGIVAWYHTSTPYGVRKMKKYHSDGIYKEITIKTEDGRETFHYEGKVEVENNQLHRYIKYYTEDGRENIVYYGIQDTMTIIEK